MDTYVTNPTVATSSGPTTGPSKRFGSSLTNWKSSHPVTPPPRDYPNEQVFRKEPIDSWDFQSPCGVQPPAAEVDISTVYLNAKRKLKTRSPYERPRKARKGNNHQPIFSTRLSDKEDVEDSNTTDGAWYEKELDRNLKKWALEAAALNPWDDPFVDTPSPYNKVGESVTGSATKMEAVKDTDTNIKEETYSTRKETCAKLEEIEEKLERLQNSARRMTRAQSQELARLSDEYSRLCAELFHLPQDLSPSASSALLQSSDGNMDINTDRHMAAHGTRSESVYSSSPLVEEVPHDNRTSLNTRFNNSLHTYLHNNTNSSFNSDSTNPSPSDPAIPLRTLQDFEEYHQYLKIKFTRASNQVYHDAPKIHRQVREEKLFLLLANKKRRVKKYWDPLSQRSGEMGSERYTRLVSRSPSDSAPGFYEKW